jgi:sporulation integral membrane protein YlbJ
VVIFPDRLLESAKNGVQLWLNQIMPTLLPFTILINILSMTGFFTFAGRALSPVMRLLFNVPGQGGIALASGFLSGYPMGAKVTAILRERGEISQVQAERLLTFTNNSGPLFILGAVGVGVFSSARAGYFIMIIHYASALITGVLFRFYKAGADDYTPLTSGAQPADDLPLGKMISESIMRSMESMLLIGGTIVLFSVISGVVAMIVSGNYAVFAAGILEMTNGVFALAQSTSNLPAANLPAANLPLEHRIILSAMFISFGGLSIHAQTAAVIKGTDIRLGVHTIAKCVQTAVTCALGFGLYPFFITVAETSQSVQAWKPFDIPAYFMYAAVCCALTVSAALIRFRKN